MMKSLMERGSRYWTRHRFTWSRDLFLNVKREDIYMGLTIPTFFKARIRPRRRPRVHMTWYIVDPPHTMDWIQSKLLQTSKKMDDGTSWTINLLSKGRKLLRENNNGTSLWKCFFNTQTRFSSLICTSKAFVELMAVAIGKFHNRHSDTRKQLCSGFSKLPQTHVTTTYLLRT